MIDRVSDHDQSDFEGRLRLTKETLHLKAVKDSNHLIGRVDAHFDQLPHSLRVRESLRDRTGVIKSHLQEAKQQRTRRKYNALYEMPMLATV